MSAEAGAIPPQPPKKRANTSLARDMSTLEIREASPEKTSEVPQTICARCSVINFNAIFSMQVLEYIGECVMPIEESIASMKGSSCSLCQLFASLAPLEASSPLQVRAFSAAKVFKLPYIDPKLDTTLLGIVETAFHYGSVEWPIISIRGQDSLKIRGYLGSQTKHRGCNSERFGVCVVEPHRFNVEFARSCLAYCREQHRESCSQDFETTPKPFRLIDCTKRLIFEATPDDKYAAVSYVWGSTTVAHIQDEPGKALTLDDCPKVINDSMEVALKLGLRNIWVDQYCIDQTDAVDKQNQINQMSLIYANAQITIIAAQSEAEGTGLSGVSELRRNQHPACQVQGHVMAPTFTDPKFSLSKSKWVTRGWTYQEAILSKRRLVFTDEQVIFDCDWMTCPEALSLPLDFIHDVETNRISWSMPAGPFGSKTRNLKCPHSEIWRHISEYSGRNLTVLTDKLHAMMGIFNFFERVEPPIYQLMGIPISLPRSSQTRRLTEETGEENSSSSEWEFLKSLPWYHKKPGERIDHFPSWSWAGWTGRINNKLDGIFMLKPMPTKVWIEEEDGSISRFPRLYPKPSFSASDEQRRHQKFLHIEAGTFKCSVVRFAVVKDLARRSYPPLILQGDRYARAVGKDSSILYLKVNSDGRLDELEMEGKSLTGIVLSNSYSSILSVLLVQELDSYAERVGVSRLFHATIASHVGGGIKSDWGRVVNWLEVNQERRVIRLG